MAKKSQQKGRAGELELTKILNGYGFTEVHPGRPLAFGSEADISGLKGVHCEVKRSERLNLYDAIRQSTEDSERFGDGMPAVFHRRNRQQWLVTMPLNSWIELYMKGYAQNEQEK